MKQLLLLLLLLSGVAKAQDYIALTNGDEFNCQILSVDKEYVIIKKDTANKKIPMFMVAKLRYNQSIKKDIIKNSTGENVSDSELTQRQNYTFDSLPILSTKTPIKLDLSGPKVLFTIGLISGITSIGCVIGLNSNDAPVFNSTSPINSQKYIEDLNKYTKDVQSYADQQRNLTNATLIAAGLGIISSAIGGIVLVNQLQQADNRLTINSRNNGFNICYRF
jgi:hypothetical protein